MRVDRKTRDIRGSSAKMHGRIDVSVSAVKALLDEVLVVDSFTLTRALYITKKDKHQTSSWDWDDNLRIYPIPICQCLAGTA